MYQVNWGVKYVILDYTSNSIFPDGLISLGHDARINYIHYGYISIFITQE